MDEIAGHIEEDVNVKEEKRWHLGPWYFRGVQWSSAAAFSVNFKFSLQKINKSTDLED